MLDSNNWNHLNYTTKQNQTMAESAGVVECTTFTSAEG